jgi:hypothetical protein
MGKKWDRLDWTDGGGMMGVGMGGREIPWPSYSGTGAAGTANATCATCAGRMRGGNKCSCDKPDWRVKGQPLNLSANAERMRKQQDSHRIWLTEAYRVLRPGGIIKAFSGTRTFHRMTAAMQEAGFVDLRVGSWNYGSGFPKSLNIGKALDKAAGVEREVIGTYTARGFSENSPTADGRDQWAAGEVVDKVGLRTAPATDTAQLWEGWGTALKPSWEPVCVGRKPE